MAPEVHATSDRYSWPGCLFGSLKDTGDAQPNATGNKLRNKEGGQDEHRY